jgi:hypothetical protein
MDQCDLWAFLLGSTCLFFEYLVSFFFLLFYFCLLFMILSKFIDFTYLLPKFPKKLNPIHKQISRIRNFRKKLFYGFVAI